LDERRAKEYREDPLDVIAEVDNTPQETDIWRHVYDQLEETQRRRACSLYLESKRKLGISRDQIPQLRGLDARLKETSNFHIAPIEGLVETRAFLSWLGKRTMLCTQYLRHHSPPHSTPQPTIFHNTI